MAAKTTYALEVILGASTSSSYYRNLNNAASGMQSLEQTASKVAAGITTVFAAVNITRAIEDAVDTYSEFEQEMATVASISNATASQYEIMEEAAMAAGRATIYTATESASALEYMSLAGWDVNTSVSALMPVLKLAAATGAELGTTSDLVTDSMSALQIGVEDIDSYLNKMIATNNNANTTAEMLMESLIKAGGAARTLGVDLDDTITATGILANNGVKAEEAGVALNAIFTRIASNSRALKELNNIGVSIFDDNGSFIGLEESLVKINEAMADFSDEQRAQSLSQIAGVHHYSQMAYLLNSVTKSVESGVSAWDELEEKVSNSNGALDTMYNTATDTLENAQAILQSAKDDMKIQLVDVFADDAKKFVLWMAEELPNATDTLVDFAEAHRGDFADALIVAGEAIEDVWDTGVAVGTWIIDHRGAVVGAITAIGTAIATVKIGSTIASLAGSLVSLATNPLGLTVLSLGAMAGAIVGIKEAVEQANEKVIDQEKAAASLAEHFGDISLSIEEIDTLARQIVGEDTLNGVTAMLEAVDDTADALDVVSEKWSDLQKEHWKLNSGFEFDAEDSEEYASQIESYISGVEEYAENKGYEAHIAATLLFGTGSEQDIESGIFYSGIQEQLTEEANHLYDVLYNTTNGALLDGIIDVKEDEIIQESLAKINAITSAISEAESKAKFDAVTLSYDAADLTPESFAQLQEDLGEYTAEVAEGAKSAYESAMTEYYARLDLDESYTKGMFDEDSKAAMEAYTKAQGDAVLNSIDYMLETIDTAYPELQEGLKQYQTDISDILSKYSDADDVDLQTRWAQDPEAVMADMRAEVYAAAQNNPIAEEKDALAQLLTQMLPTVQELEPVMKAYEEAGTELPEDIAAVQEYWQALYTLVNTDEDIAAIDLTDAMSADNAFQGFVNDIGLEIDETHMTVQRKIDEAYQDGFDVSTDLRVQLDTTTSQSVTGAGAIKRGNLLNALSNLNIAQNAEGGIYNTPLLTTFAEEGPESAIPLDGSDRAKSLWVQTGQILGMFSGGTTRDRAMYNAVSGSSSGEETSHTIQVTYSPNITIQGNASKEEVTSAVSMGINELRSMLAEIVAENQRVSFS